MRLFSSLFGGLEYDLEGLEKETSEYPSSEEENGNGKNDSGGIYIPPDPDMYNKRTSPTGRKKEIPSWMKVNKDSLIPPDLESNDEIPDAWDYEKNKPIYYNDNR